MAILTSLQPLVAPLPGCSSGKPVQDQLARGFVLQPNSTFFSTAFGPPARTMVVFWKDDSGRQPSLITPESEGGDETSSPSPPKVTFFDDLDVPFRPRPRLSLCQSRGPYPESQDPPAPPDNPGFPPGLSPVPPPAGGDIEQERWINRVNDRARDHHYHILNFSTFQRVMVTMTSHHRLEDNGNGLDRPRERSYSHAQVPQEPQVQPMVIPELVTDPDEDRTVVNPSSSTGISPRVEQRDRSRRKQRSRSRERTPQRTLPHTPTQYGQQPQHVVPPPGEPQTQPLAENQKLWNHSAA